MIRDEYCISEVARVEGVEMSPFFLILKMTLVFELPLTIILSWMELKHFCWVALERLKNRLPDS